MDETDGKTHRHNRDSSTENAKSDSIQIETSRPPTVQYLCLEQTLYSDVSIDPKRDFDYLRSLRYGAQQFDAHCTYCCKGATFRTFGDRSDPELKQLAQHATFNTHAKDRLRRLILEEGQFTLHLRCSRNPNHLYSYFFNYDEKIAKIQKIGQMPSLEDVAGSDIERYRKILGSDFIELRKATGLFAHGIGIGSFVYLRRIFEGLVENARTRAETSGKDAADFSAMRMTERIDALSEHLPRAVVKYKEAYGILSKGIHELSEEECKRYFPAIRAAVIMMLEQRYEAAEKARVESELDRAISAISSDAKSR
jgi:hypothetical protein